MAVTKIRKISSWTLLICSLITIVVLAIYFFGGVIDPTADNQEPIYTDILLYWGYIVFGLAALSTIGFAIWQFVNSLKTDPKGALMGLGAIVALLAVLLISYSIGDDTPLPMINADSAHFNVASWLKITDMWIYTTYTLIILIVLAVIGGTVKKILNR